MWKFIVSASNKSNWYSHSGKEICFVGRSNVGKSSLINALAKAKIAKTSNTPGRTQLINYFQDDFHNIITDLPGYGYAKMSKINKQKMLNMIEEYFRDSEKLATIFLLFDANIGPTSYDDEMLDYFLELGRKVILVGTKIDKCNQSSLSKTLKALKKYNCEAILVSSTKKRNLDKLYKIILDQF